MLRVIKRCLHSRKRAGVEPTRNLIDGGRFSKNVPQKLQDLQNAAHSSRSEYNTYSSSAVIKLIVCIPESRLGWNQPKTMLMVAGSPRTRPKYLKQQQIQSLCSFTRTWFLGTKPKAHMSSKIAWYPVTIELFLKEIESVFLGAENETFRIGWTAFFPGLIAHYSQRLRCFEKFAFGLKFIG